MGFELGGLVDSDQVAVAMLKEARGERVFGIEKRSDGTFARLGIGGEFVGVDEGFVAESDFVGVFPSGAEVVGAGAAGAGVGDAGGIGAGAATGDGAGVTGTTDGAVGVGETGGADTTDDPPVATTPDWVAGKAAGASGSGAIVSATIESVGAITTSVESVGGRVEVSVGIVEDASSGAAIANSAAADATGPTFDGAVPITMVDRTIPPPTHAPIRAMDLQWTIFSARVRSPSSPVSMAATRRCVVPRLGP